MSDVRERLLELMKHGTDGDSYDDLADAILEKFDVTRKPEPPVFQSCELGAMATAVVLSPEVVLTWTVATRRGDELKRLLAERGMEIVRKAETE